MNFPNCTLSPTDISGQTQGEEATEQLKSFNIIARPLPYGEDNFVVLTLDMAIEENKTYNRDDLLENGWYDEASLTAVGGA